MTGHMFVTRGNLTKLACDAGCCRFLLAEASKGASPLLNRSFKAILTSEEQEIARRLHALESGISDAVRASPAWHRVQALLDEFRG